MQKRSSREAVAIEPPSSPGLSVRWLAGQEELGSDQMVLGITEFSPGAAHGLHRHPDADSASVVLSGVGEHLSDGAPVRQGPDQAVAIPRGAWHGFANRGGSSVRLATFYAGVGSAAQAGYETRNRTATGTGAASPSAGPDGLGPHGRLELGLEGRPLLADGAGPGDLRLALVGLEPGKTAWWPLGHAGVLLLVRSGRLVVEASGEDLLARADEVVHLPPGRTYELAAEGAQAAQLLVAHLAEPTWPRRAPDLHPSVAA